MRYSKYFTKHELCYSHLAKKLGINQEEKLAALPPQIEECLKCLSWFLTAIRVKWNAPIYVSSGYRCKVVNAAVGGAKNSYHLIGAAADIYVEPTRLFELYNLIKNNFKCQELYINYRQNYIHVVPKDIFYYGKAKNQTYS